MRVIHLLRKFDTAEWGGTESAVERLFVGLRQLGVTPVMFCPRVNRTGAPAGLPAVEDQNVAPEPNNRLSTVASHDGGSSDIKRFKSFLPAWGMSPQEKRRLIAVGGNLMSFDLLPAMWREPDIALVHTHTLGRLGGIASMVARGRGLPFVVSIHGGLLDLPPAMKGTINEPVYGGFDWGKIGSIGKE